MGDSPSAQADGRLAAVLITVVGPCASSREAVVRPGHLLTRAPRFRLPRGQAAAFSRTAAFVSASAALRAALRLRVRAAFC